MSSGYFCINTVMHIYIELNKSTILEGMQWAGSVLQQVLHSLSLTVAFNKHAGFVSQVNSWQRVISLDLLFEILGTSYLDL
jgi:hypothetical protein